jgi:phospholipid/cholesterol/gamma-HCH transport system substrate-binding protein
VPLKSLESEAVVIELMGWAPRSSLNVESRARWIFAAILLIGVALGLTWSSVASSRYATYQIRTHDAVSGLIVDAPVEFHGVEVGKVARVELAGPASVSILLRIRKDAPVTSATVATIISRGVASRGFTGYVYVALEDDGSEAQPVADPSGTPYRQLRTGPSRSVNLDTAISQVNANVQAMNRLLQTALDAKTIESLQLSLNSMQKVMRTLAANSEKMNAIILNAERASSRLGPLLESGNQTARALQTQALPRAYEALAKLDRLATSLSLDAERASSRLEPLLESGNDTARALQTQVLPEAYEALSNLNRLSTSLNNATARIERDPSVLIRGTGRPAPGPGETR